MSQTFEQHELLMDAIVQLGWDKLADKKNQACDDAERAILTVDRGKGPKAARYAVYQQWASRAGCAWNSKRMFGLPGIVALGTSVSSIFDNSGHSGHSKAHRNLRET